MPFAIADTIYKVRKDFKFDYNETIAVLTAIISSAIIIGFNDNSRVFDITGWIIHFVESLVLVGAVILVHISVQKVYGFYQGFRVEYKLWLYGIGIGLIIALLSKGRFWFLAPGGIFLHFLPAHRLGWFRPGTNITSYGTIAFSGPLASIFFVSFFKTLDIWFGWHSALISKLFVIGWVYAIGNLLPIPPLDGSRFFYYSRLTYAFTVGSIAGYGLLIYFLGIFSFFWALLIGGIVWILYYIFFESKVLL